MFQQIFLTRSMPRNIQWIQDVFSRDIPPLSALHCPISHRFYTVWGTDKVLGMHFPGFFLTTCTSILAKLFVCRFVFPFRVQLFSVTSRRSLEFQSYPDRASLVFFLSCFSMWNNLLSIVTSRKSHMVQCFVWLCERGGIFLESERKKAREKQNERDRGIEGRRTQEQSWLKTYWMLEDKLLNKRKAYGISTTNQLLQALICKNVAK